MSISRRDVRRERQDRRFGFCTAGSLAGLSGGTGACSTLETVPDDFFARLGGLSLPVPRYLRILMGRYLKYVPRAYKAEVPALFAMKVRCPSTFGGRWFAPGFKGASGPSIVVILHPDESYQRAVLQHELTHWLRWLDSQKKDWEGRHDAAFLQEVEKAYKTFGVDRSVAVNIEHTAKPGFMSAD